MALWGMTLLTLGHVGAFAAEQLHLLQPGALFVDTATLHSVPLFRWGGALASITGVYWSVFWVSNFAATAFREKDVALNAARKDVARAIEEGQPGPTGGEYW